CLVELARIVGEVMNERDSALRLPVGKLKLMEDLEVAHRLFLGGFAGGKRLRADVRVGHAHGASGARNGAGPRSQKRQSRNRRQEPRAPEQKLGCGEASSVHEDRYSNRGTRRSGRATDQLLP